jgi:hypothetical protein
MVELTISGWFTVIVQVSDTASLGVFFPQESLLSCSSNPPAAFSKVDVEAAAGLSLGDRVPSSAIHGVGSQNVQIDGRNQKSNCITTGASRPCAEIEIDTFRQLNRDCGILAAELHDCLT